MKTMLMTIMKKIARIALLGALLIAPAFLATARPLQRADVAAQPAWVAHIDCDALRPTALGQFLLAELNKPEVQAKFAVFETIFSFDPRTELHGLTLYSTGIAPQDGVLIVYADFKAAQLENLAKAANGYESTTHNSHVIHSWIDEKKKAKDGVKPRVYAAIQGNRVIFGQQSDRVAQALDVLDNTAPTLAGTSNFPQLGAGSTTSFIQAAARKLDLPDSDPNAALMRLSQFIRLQVGESQGNVNTELTLEANSDEVAGHMLSIAQGLVALMKLQTEKADQVKVAEATTLRQDGSRLLVNVAMPVNQVIEMMKAAAARKAAQ